MEGKKRTKKTKSTFEYSNATPLQLIMSPQRKELKEHAFPRRRPEVGHVTNSYRLWSHTDEILDLFPGKFAKANSLTNGEWKGLGMATQWYQLLADTARKGFVAHMRERKKKKGTASAHDDEENSFANYRSRFHSEKQLNTPHQMFGDKSFIYDSKTNTTVRSSSRWPEIYEGKTGGLLQKALEHLEHAGMKFVDEVLLGKTPQS